jgi:NAD(P)-dependent dehydrogenase (short-subunit alcohol dehydrogenase family)
VILLPQAETFGIRGTVEYLRSKSMNITGKSILITGGNRGIGRALVEEALQRGVKRVYAAVRGDFQHPDKRVTTLKLDVTDASQIQQAAAKVGALDILINNAGIALYDDLSNPDALEQQLAVNLFGPLNVTRAFLPQLKQSKGAIVNNVSLGALAAIPIIPGYSMSKAALFNVTQSLRALLASHGVSVRAVIIGPTDTEMNRGFNIPKASTETHRQGNPRRHRKGRGGHFSGSGLSVHCRCLAQRRGEGHGEAVRRLCARDCLESGLSDRNLSSDAFIKMEKEHEIE